MGKFFYINLFNHYKYRPNVACILYKKEGDQKKILIVRREDNDQHWQLPQGGTDGEDIATAGRRELQEETGVKNASLITKGIFKNVHRYKFNNDSGKRVYQQKVAKRYRYNGYKGQSQSLLIAEFIGSDNEIKINFWDHIDWKWIPADKLVEEVHPYRKTGAKIFLEKFKSLNL